MTELFAQESGLQEAMAAQEQRSMCIECEDQAAVVQCRQCGDVYCEPCYEDQHRTGNRKRHDNVKLCSSGGTSKLPDPKEKEMGELSGVSIPDPVSVSQNPVENLLSGSEDNLPNDAGQRMDLEGEQAMGLLKEGRTTESSVSLPSRPGSKPAAHLVAATKFIPLRLNLEEREYLELLEAALEVSEYTDKVDVIRYGSKLYYIEKELEDMYAIMSGLVVSGNYRSGKRLIDGRKFSDNGGFFAKVFEVGRRFKVMNPDKMRANYGKMMHLLQDAQSRDIQEEFGFSCVTPLSTVHRFLEQNNLLSLLEDELVDAATQVITADSLRPRDEVKRAVEEKQAAVEAIVQKYSSDQASGEDIRRCLSSIGDYYSYMASNRQPIDQMIQLLKTYFHPEIADGEFSLQILAGRNGARLSHSHQRQYQYALQSLLLWRAFTSEMFRLWYSAEQDLLSGNPYRLRETGQGLHRIQQAPMVSKVVSGLLRRVQSEVNFWVGSSVVHLGDHNVPNAFVFIDKYTQVYRILQPIVFTIAEIDRLESDPSCSQYINKCYGGKEKLKKTILCDFFKHGFDGSGADNFFDAGSCIDGRLTSAWNWCSKIEKKSYYYVFQLCGFVGFDGDFS